jgi:hypothetical protein
MTDPIPPGSATPPAFDNSLLEQYTAYLADVGNIGVRSENSRRFYLSVVSALLVFLSMTGDKGPFIKLQWPVQVIVGITGIIICVLWFLHMRSFGALFRAKFSVLREMEAHGLAFPIFKREWELLRDDTRFTLLSIIDAGMPWVFALISVAIVYLKQ